MRKQFLIYADTRVADAYPDVAADLVERLNVLKEFPADAAIHLTKNGCDLKSQNFRNTPSSR